MKTALNPGETSIREGKANLQRGWETVGGALTLTSQRLVFEPHALNAQTAVESIALADVTGTALAWTKFLNVVPLVPNSLSIQLANGQERRFVVFGRGEWQTAIDAARSAARR